MDMHDEDGVVAKVDIQSDRLWEDDGWRAKVIKNEDDEGWAVEITKEGNPEPVLVAPWTMGRDKKNPKPLDANAFYTWIKTAAEVLGRHEQQLRARMHKSVKIYFEEEHMQVDLDITADEYEPYSTLSAFDAAGDPIATARARADFKLTTESAMAWAKSGYKSQNGG